MKKLCSFLAATFINVCLFAAPATAPTAADLSAVGDLANDVILALYFDEEVCNDMVLVGTYNDWNVDDVAALKRFEKLDGFDGWYVASFPWAEGALGKAVQLKSDGSFDWKYQTGDADAWINQGGKDANIEPGYDGEANVGYPEAGAYIYEIAYFKLHNSPCEFIPKYYDLTTIGTSIDSWTIGEGASINYDKSDFDNNKYTFDITGGIECASYITSAPGVEFHLKNTSDKSNAFSIMLGTGFVFQGKNGRVVVKNTKSGDIIRIKVASKGSTGANFLDDTGTYPINATVISEELQLPAKDGNFEWHIIEYRSFGGDVEIKEFSGGFAVAVIQVGEASSDSPTDNVFWEINLKKSISEKYNNQMVYSFAPNNSDRNFWVWEDTYVQNNADYISLTVTDAHDWAGAGFNVLENGTSYDEVSTLFSQIKAHPDIFHLRFSVRATDHATHTFRIFDIEELSITLGTKKQYDADVYGDFERNGMWHEFDIPMSFFSAEWVFLNLVNQKDNINIFGVYSEAIPGATICIDNVYIYANESPIPSNTPLHVHVQNAGSFGLTLLQFVDQLSDVTDLVVTGSLNKQDMSLFSRLTNCKSLDLSGTDIASFQGCSGLSQLETVALPSTVQTIEKNAFRGCSNLSFIQLENIQTVEDYAFYQCSSLKELNMPRLLSVGNYAFAFANDYYAYSNSSSSLESVQMPIVLKIGEYAFCDNEKLASVMMPLVTSIGTCAFCNCYALEEVDLSNLTELGNSAFYMYSNKYSGLSRVTLSDELVGIPDGCFYGCAKLTSISLPSSLKSIGEKALPYITDVQLPSAINSVGADNFINARSITIPAKVTSWNSYSSNWQDVYCHVVVPQTFSVFNTDYVSSATLHVPAMSLAAYKLHDNWYKFGKIIAMDGAIDDLTINGDFTLLTADGIANKANLTITAGGALTMSADNALSVGSYVQEIGCMSKKYGYDYYYDENHDYIRNYYSYLPFTGMLKANSEISADAVVVKLVPVADHWNFFSLPFDVNVADITIGIDGMGEVGSSQWVIYEYSGANRASGNGDTWVKVSNDGLLKAHTGYILYWMVENSGTHNNNYDDYYYEYDDYNFHYYFNLPAVNNDNMQHIFASGDVDVALTQYSAEFPQNRNWNLVGNPYPCAFDIRQMDFEAPITIWNGSSYVAYTTIDDNYLLRPAEGFFVQAPEGVDKITFHKDGRTNVNRIDVTQEEYYHHIPTRRSQVSNREMYNFTISNEQYSDRARLVLNENASCNYELRCDAAKMMSTDRNVPQLYIYDNHIRYAIDERPEAEGIFRLGAFIGKAGEYTINVQNDDAQRAILLTDKLTNKTVDLTQEAYTFISEIGTFNDRFTLTFGNRMPTGLDDVQDDKVQATKVLINGQMIIVSPQGKKYTVGGIEL